MRKGTAALRGCPQTEKGWTYGGPWETCPRRQAPPRESHTSRPPEPPGLPQHGLDFTTSAHCSCNERTSSVENHSRKEEKEPIFQKMKKLKSDSETLSEQLRWSGSDRSQRFWRKATPASRAQWPGQTKLASTTSADLNPSPTRGCFLLSTELHFCLNVVIKSKKILWGSVFSQETNTQE